MLQHNIYKTFGTEVLLGGASHVYVLMHKNGGRFKIGKANDVEQRMRALGIERFSAEKSFALRFKTEKRSTEVERLLHRTFSKWRCDKDAVTLEDGIDDGATEFFATDCYERAKSFIEANLDLFDCVMVDGDAGTAFHARHGADRIQELEQMQASRLALQLRKAEQAQKKAQRDAHIGGKKEQCARVWKDDTDGPYQHFMRSLNGYFSKAATYLASNTEIVLHNESSIHLKIKDADSFQAKFFALELTYLEAKISAKITKRFINASFEQIADGTMILLDRVKLDFCEASQRDLWRADVVNNKFDEAWKTFWQPLAGNGK